MSIGDLLFQIQNERARLHPPFVAMNNVCGRTKADSSSPTAVYPILPTEIIDNICQRLDICDLANLVRANSVLNVVGTKRLYHTIGVEMRPARLLQCMISLDRNADMPLLVRTFEVNLANNLPTRTCYLLLERILKKMVNLTTLVVELPKHHSPTWALPMPPLPTASSKLPSRIFRLHSFTTSMHCKSSLARFLDSQPEITELTLRGIDSDLENSFLTTLLHSIGAFAPDNPLAALLVPQPSQFILLPTSLPKLSHFNAVHAGPTVIRNIISSRPVTHMSIPILPSQTMDTLLALSSSSKPLVKLTVMSFDPAALQFLFPELSVRFMELESLNIVALIAEVTAEMLLQWGVYLAGFKKMKYITFMATLEDDGDGREEIDEKKIAQAWHSSCPTLQTVILPHGKVWFEATTTDDEKSDRKCWKCLDEEDE